MKLENSQCIEVWQGDGGPLIGYVIGKDDPQGPGWQAYRAHLDDDNLDLTWLDAGDSSQEMIELLANFAGV